MTPDPNPDPMRDQMVHLLTGNLRGLPALRLRRRIARDPALAREWNALEALVTQLQQTSLPTSMAPVPRWRGRKEPDLSVSALRRNSLKHGFVALAVLALPILGIFTTLYVRSYVRSEQSYTFSRRMGTEMQSGTGIRFKDINNHSWIVEADCPTEVDFLNESGIEMGSIAGFPQNVSGEVRVTRDGQSFEAVRGIGLHTLHAPNGTTAGYIEITPSYADHKNYNALRDIEVLALYDTSRTPIFVTKHASSLRSYQTALPGLYSSVERELGLAWKLRGYATVNVQCNKTTYIPPGQSLPFTPALTNSKEQEPVLAEAYKYAPKPGTEPIIFWSLAPLDPDYNRSPHLVVDGRWLDARRSGQMRGYGQHIIKNEKGKVLFTFDVQPLKPDADMAGPPPRR